MSIVSISAFAGNESDLPQKPQITQKSITSAAEASTSSANNETLPLEVLEKIFSELERKDLKSVSETCKHWNLASTRCFELEKLALELRVERKAGDNHFALFDKALSSEHSYIRGWAIWHLSNDPKGQTFFKLWEKALSDPIDENRLRAVQALKKYEGKNSLALWEKGLSDKSPDFRRYAAEELPFYKGKDSFALFKTALSDSDSLVRLHATKALKAYEGKDLFELLNTALSDKERYVRVEAAKLLKPYRLKVTNPTALFEKALLDEDEEVVSLAEDALPSRRGESTFALWEKTILKNPTLATPYLKDYDGDHLFELLDGILSDGREGQRVFVVQVLRSYKGKNPFKLWEKAVSDKSREVRVNAVRAIPYYQGENSFELWEKVLSDNDSYIRWEAAIRLNEYKGENSFELYKKALSHQDFEVRRVAEMSLSGYKGENPSALFEIVLNNDTTNNDLELLRFCKKDPVKGYQVLFQLFKSPNSKVRNYALVTLERLDPQLSLIRKADREKVKSSLESCRTEPLPKIIGAEEIEEILNHLKNEDAK